MTQSSHDMPEVVVLGGYGHAGRVCIAELIRSTRAHIVVAGPSIQRAERLAAAFAGRARAAYGNAEDPRTLERLIQGKACIVLCCAADPLVVLNLATRVRVPVLSLSSVQMDRHTSFELQQRAWDAQIPVILEAGAAPGLAGVLAEYLVRHHEMLYEIRIASTGPWIGSSASRSSQRARHKTRRKSLPNGARHRPLRWTFPDPIGTRWVRPALATDLEGFAATHCVEQVSYLEAEVGSLSRGLHRIVRRHRNDGFAMVAEASLRRDTRGLRQRITLQAHDPRSAAAAAVGTLVQNLLQGHMASGFFLPREALNPDTFLGGLEKRGVHVTTSLD